MITVQDLAQAVAVMANELQTQQSTVAEHGPPSAQPVNGLVVRIHQQQIAEMSVQFTKDPPAK